MKKILVTGDRGYIGSTLVPLLIEKGYEVTGYDSNYFIKTLGPEKKYSYKKITKDIRDISLQDIQGIDAIIHLAALSNDASGDLNPSLTDEINYKASVKLAEIAKKAHVKRFLFSSSCSIYGKAEGEVDEATQVNPLTAYAKSKIDTEKALQKLSDGNFCVGLLRNSTVYGYAPKFRNDLVVNNLTTIAYIYNEIQIASDGTPWRPLIDVRDLSKIFMEFLTIDDKKINGEVINVGFTENNVQVRDIGDIIHTILPHSEIVYTGKHPDSRSYRVNFQKFENIFPHIKQDWPILKSVEDLISYLKKAQYKRQDFENEIFARLEVLKQYLKIQKVDNNLRFIK